MTKIYMKYLKLVKVTDPDEAAKLHAKFQADLGYDLNDPNYRSPLKGELFSGGDITFLAYNPDGFGADITGTGTADTSNVVTGGK